MSLLEKLPHWFESKPLVLLKFSDGFWSDVSATKHGLGRFTVVRNHEAFSELKLPSLCLAEMPVEKTHKFFVGVVKSKAAVGTFASRVTVLKLQALNLSTFEQLTSALDGKIFQTLLKDRLTSKRFATVLSPKVSVAIIDALSKDPANRKAIETAAAHVPKLRRISSAEWEQFDAIKTAMAAFGLSKSDSPVKVEVPVDSDSTLNYLDSNEDQLVHVDSPEDESDHAHVLEDNVIAKDASVIPGFELIEKHMTGKAVFSNRNERLEVYTANKGPLEIMLGVDLIYINESVGNTVMVQYKMLERHVDPVTGTGDWGFRPNNQFELEVARMKLPTLNGTIEDYRLHRSPFYFKFVKRKGDGESHASFVVSLNHLQHVLDSPKSKGPKGGVRVSFDSLDGVYLRETDLLGLIRSGYIGTHRIETEALKPIIQAVAEGKRALVLAWQKAIKEGDKQ
jgi:hypothetical protein